MSEQENKSRSGVGGSCVVEQRESCGRVLVEQSAASRHKQPFRSMELQEESPELHHKRSRAPAVPSVADELKSNANTEIKDRRECDRAILPDEQKPSLSKKLLNVKRRGSSPETIRLGQIETDTKKNSASTQPIPPHAAPVSSDVGITIQKASAERMEENDSINEEIAELRAPEVVKKSSEWSDEEEAGGLPRSESRASRVSRAVRQLLCCGVRVDAPSEYAVSPRLDAL